MHGWFPATYCSPASTPSQIHSLTLVFNMKGCLSSRRSYFHLLVCLSWVFLQGVSSEVCRQSPCEYTLTIRHGRTMIYRPKDDPKRAYAVGINGTRLQVSESAYLKPGHKMFGQFVDDIEDVITADGVSRTIITVNGQFPGPTIEVEEGVQIVVRVVNRMHTDGVTIHWHGIYHKGDMWMDGAAQVTQCPIPPYQSFTYRFIAEPVGTHWYHGHHGMIRLDGLYGMLIIHPKKGSSTSQTLEEGSSFNLMVSDWIHNEANDIEVTNPHSQEASKGAGEHLHAHYTVAEYTVDNADIGSSKYISGIINGRGRFDPAAHLPLTRFNVNPGRHYRFRSVNVGKEVPYTISIDNHPLTIVALDGIDVMPYQVDSVDIAAGEAVDFEIFTDQPTQLYWVRARTLSKTPREILAILHYVGSDSKHGEDPNSKPRACTSLAPCTVLNCPFPEFPPGDNRKCVPISDMVTVKDYIEDYGLNTKDEDIVELFLNAGFAWGSSINGRKFLQPTAPLYQKDRGFVSCDEVCQDQTKGCVCTGTYRIPTDKTIQLILGNIQEGVTYVGPHPMHLHGHSFTVLKIGYGTYNSTNGHYLGQTKDITCANSLCRSPMWTSGRPTLNLNKPPVKNTVVVPARGYVVVRFRSDNPGRWLYHCHVATHNKEGMKALIEEGGDDQLPPVPDNFPTCESFDWTAEEYEKYKSGVHDKEKGQLEGQTRGKELSSNEKNKNINTAKNTPRDEETLNDKGLQTADDHVIKKADDDMLTINGYAFAGVLVAAVVLGVLLACFVFYCLNSLKSNSVDKISTAM